MLVVEDGTGVAGANSYVTDPEAVAFLATRGLEASWTGQANFNVREGWLVQAADFENATFSWASVPLSAAQTMAFPRLAWDGVPAAVRQAQILLALELAQGRALGSLMGERGVRKETKKLDGVGEKTTEYDDPAQYGATPTVPTLIGLLGPYTLGSLGRTSLQVARRLVG